MDPRNIDTNIARFTFATGDDLTKKRTLLSENAYRTFFMVYNNSNYSIYIAVSPNPATAKNFTIKIGPHTLYEPAAAISDYPGEITWNPTAAGQGDITVTEFAKLEQ